MKDWEEKRRQKDVESISMGVGLVLGYALSVFWLNQSLWTWLAIIVAAFPAIIISLIVGLMAGTLYKASRANPPQSTPKTGTGITIYPPGFAHYPTCSVNLPSSNRHHELVASSHEDISPLQEWHDSLTTLWEGSLHIHFGYKWGPERTQRDVNLEQIQAGDNGKLYLFGFCQTRNERRHFNIEKISSKIKVPAHKKYYHADEFIEMILGEA